MQTQLSYRRDGQTDGQTAFQLYIVEVDTIVSILGLFTSQEINTVNTFGRQPLTPQALSAFMVMSDERNAEILCNTHLYRILESRILSSSIIL